MDKSELRIKAKELRKTLDIQSISKNICSQIRNLEIYKSAQNVMIFYPMKYEINLLDLLNDDKKFYLPKVQEDKILVCPYENNLKKSNMNIMEPCSNPVSSDILDLIFVPALMVDKNNYRLGYGGGFYDRFLSQNLNITTIVPIAKELVVKSLPEENFDIKVNLIITDL